MKLDKAITDVQSAEADLVKELRTIGERHAGEHDLYHLGHTLAKQCSDHLGLLAPSPTATARRRAKTASPSRPACSRHCAIRAPSCSAAAKCRESFSSATSATSTSARRKLRSPGSSSPR